MKFVGYMFGRRKSTPPVFILQKKIGYMPRENGPVWSKDIYMFVRRKSTTRPFVNKSNGDFLGTNRIFPLQDQTLIREVANFDPLYFLLCSWRKNMDVHLLDFHQSRHSIEQPSSEAGQLRSFGCLAEPGVHDHLDSPYIWYLLLCQSQKLSQQTFLPIITYILSLIQCCLRLVINYIILLFYLLFDLFLEMFYVIKIIVEKFVFSYSMCINFEH